MGADAKKEPERTLSLREEELLQGVKSLISRYQHEYQAIIEDMRFILQWAISEDNVLELLTKCNQLYVLMNKHFVENNPGKDFDAVAQDFMYQALGEHFQPRFLFDQIEKAQAWLAFQDHLVNSENQAVALAGRRLEQFMQVATDMAGKAVAVLKPELDKLILRKIVLMEEIRKIPGVKPNSARWVNDTNLAENDLFKEYKTVCAEILQNENSMRACPAEYQAIYDNLPQLVKNQNNRTATLDDKNTKPFNVEIDLADIKNQVQDFKKLLEKKISHDSNPKRIIRAGILADAPIIEVDSKFVAGLRELEKINLKEEKNVAQLSQKVVSIVNQYKLDKFADANHFSFQKTRSGLHRDVHTFQNEIIRILAQDDPKRQAELIDQAIRNRCNNSKHDYLHKLQEVSSLLDEHKAETASGIRSALANHLLNDKNHLLKKEQHFFRFSDFSNNTRSMHIALKELGLTRNELQVQGATRHIEEEVKPPQPRR